MVTFSQRLKTLRKKKFLTQQKLADILEVKRATIAKWESKNAIPDIDTLHKISNYFDVNVDYLVGLTDDKQYPEPPNDNENDLFNVTAENIYIFTEVAKKEGLSLDLIGKLIQSLSFPKDKEKSLFKTLNIHYEDDTSNNSTTKNSNNNE
ncbi:TPA: helix-turn-helix transcriptional regulator [Streptococcus agalactiae]|nr:helix-turn-helix transcriptional regulator [Streptococcus agalactiae]